MQPLAAERSGALLFARYAHPPNALGYCGPEDGGASLDRAAAGGGAGLAAWAEEFDGVWPYLRVIAEAAGIPDPLDERVVEAYWVGNDLLDRVDPERFAEVMHRAFDAQVGGRWRSLGPGSSGAAHHSFHVFEVYPWVRLLRSNSPTPLSVLDRCRIRWGTVVGVEGEQAVVTSRPLEWDGRILVLGTARTERARWSAGGRSLIPAPSPGVEVSLHWDWLCDVLSPRAVASLQHHNARQLAATNGWLQSVRA